MTNTNPQSSNIPYGAGKTSILLDYCKTAVEISTRQVNALHKKVEHDHRWHIALGQVEEILDFYKWMDQKGPHILKAEIDPQHADMSKEKAEQIKKEYEKLITELSDVMDNISNVVDKMSGTTGIPEYQDPVLQKLTGKFEAYKIVVELGKTNPNNKNINSKKLDESYVKVVKIKSDIDTKNTSLLERIAKQEFTIKEMIDETKAFTETSSEYLGAAFQYFDDLKGRCKTLLKRQILDNRLDKDTTSN